MRGVKAGGRGTGRRQLGERRKRGLARGGEGAALRRRTESKEKPWKKQKENASFSISRKKGSQA